MCCVFMHKIKANLICFSCELGALMPHLLAISYFSALILKVQNPGVILQMPMWLATWHSIKSGDI